jgi:hypothetical protein
VAQQARTVESFQFHFKPVRSQRASARSRFAINDKGKWNNAVFQLTPAFTPGLNGPHIARALALPGLPGNGFLEPCQYPKDYAICREMIIASKRFP